eukprot:1161868-Pelagomonas_calceolata.AAC.11
MTKKATVTARVTRKATETAFVIKRCPGISAQPKATYPEEQPLKANIDSNCHPHIAPAAQIHMFTAYF